jgi:hypothetical protein
MMPVFMQNATEAEKQQVAEIQIEYINVDAELKQYLNIGADYVIASGINLIYQLLLEQYKIMREVAENYYMANVEIPTASQQL